MFVAIKDITPEKMGAWHSTKRNSAKQIIHLQRKAVIGSALLKHWLYPRY